MIHILHILPCGLAKFRRFAVQVWGVGTEGRTDEQIAREGLAALEGWMRELGLTMSIGALGATKEMIPGITAATLILKGGYRVLTGEEIAEILRESL